VCHGPFFWPPGARPQEDLAPSFFFSCSLCHDMNHPRFPSVPPANTSLAFLPAATLGPRESPCLASRFSAALQERLLRSTNWISLFSLCCGCFESLPSSAADFLPRTPSVNHESRGSPPRAPAPGGVALLTAASLSSSLLPRKPFISVC